MSAFTLYRLSFDNPLQFYEQFGDPVTTTGGAPVPALRGALRHSVSVATFTGGVSETIAERLKLRRQFRSLVNNTPMKLTGLYLSWESDPENNGWYMPDQGQLIDLEGSTGLATGVFKVENAVWILAGRPRTHKRAAWVLMKDLRTGLRERDYRRAVYLTDFSTIAALQLSYMPPGISDPLTTGGIATQPAPLPSGSDGGAVFVTAGLIDQARIAFEQAKLSINRGQVVAYDRRGEQTAPSIAPGPLWEEFYGPDYPYSWQEGSAIDTPVIENGRCRVRWDSTGKPGFRVDVWASGAWEEQGKMTFGRLTGTNPFLDTLVSASLTEYGEGRAVVQCVMKASTDPNSREEIFITLQRGWSGPRFEVYTSPTGGGVYVDAYMVFALAKADSDDSAIKIDTNESGPASIVATATGAGHSGSFPVAGIGAATFTGLNMVQVGRWGQTYGVTFGVHRASTSPETTVSEAYGAGIFRNAVSINGSTKDGYLSVFTAFPEQLGQSAQEAESMTLGTGTTVVTDSEASGGKATAAKRTSDATAHVTTPKWPNSKAGTYRLMARVKATSGTLKIYGLAASHTGATVSVAASATPVYQWVDLGEFTTAGTSELAIHAWQTAAVNFDVDRIETFLVEDRFTPGVSQYQGSRDLAAAILYDSRMIPTIVSRST